ncbi:unnamed protein product [Gadus morhua 'NCC']
MVSLGLKSKRTAKLIPTAVPSVHANHSACPVPRSRDTVCRKREIATMLTDASQQETVASVDTVESVDTGDQPLPSSTSDAGTQCFLKPPRWSHAVQVNLKPKMVSVGTQTSISPQTSTPLASPEQTVDNDDDDNATVISDLSWVPEEPMDEEELFDEEPPYTCDPHHNCIDKFIVCQEELMGLFAICPACCERSDSSIVQQEGTFVKIKQVCASCGYHRFWQNQPMLHRNMRCIIITMPIARQHGEVTGQRSTACGIRASEKVPMWCVPSKRQPHTALRESYANSPAVLREVGANLSSDAPAPIAKSFEQIPKEEAIGLYLARQSRFEKT